MPKPSPEFRKVFQALRRHGLLLESDARLPSLTQIVADEPIKGSWWGHPKGRLIFRITNQIDDHPDVLVTKLISGKVTFVHRKLWPALLAVATAREAWQTRNLSPTARALLKLVTENGQVQTDQLSGVSFSKNVSRKRSPGSTGDPPVPSGDSPDGTGATVRENEDGLFATWRPPVPVGESPTGAGESPALPIFKTLSKSISQATRELEMRLLVHSEQFHSDAGSHAKCLETWEHWARRAGIAEKLPAADQAKAGFEKIVTALNQRFDGKGKLPWGETGQ